MRITIPESASAKNASINLTPMIDMVFLLIIFFLVSSNMVQQESSIPVDLPQAKTGEIQKDNDQSKKIVITVLGDGSIVIGTQTMTLDQLEKHLVLQRQLTFDSLKIRIRADRMTPYGSVEPIMTRCIEAGISDVVFSVIQK